MEGLRYSNEKSKLAALSCTVSQRKYFSWPKAGLSDRERLGWGVYLYTAKKKLEMVAQKVS